MSLFTDLTTKYKVLSVVGMAKNAGKTTALNYLVSEAYDEDVILGITSTGRDGEGTDLVTGTEKPKVYLTEDMIVTVPTSLYEVADAGLEIIKMSSFYSTFGQIMLCRVVEAGYVQVAGPTSTADQKRLSKELLNLGAEMVIIDGAIDRRSIANPDASDAIILATGAVISRNVKQVVSGTAHVIDLYGLPVVEDEKVRLRLQGENSLVTFKDGESLVQSCKTGLVSSQKFDRLIDYETDYIYLPGALTSHALEHVFPDKLESVTFIVQDPTKIFIDSMAWRRLRKRGLKVQLLKGIEIALISVNPYSPEGYAFDHIALLKAMREIAGDIPVIDVKKPDAGEEGE